MTENNRISFKNRTREIQELSRYLHSKTFQFIIIYGRRRVGKTALVLNACKGLRSIYFLAEKAGNISRFIAEASILIPDIRDLKEDYHLLFKHLAGKVDVIIIDEFPNMITEDPNIPHIFQTIVDHILNQSTTKLILLGSSISMMSTYVLANPSPLYGRKTASLKLQPLSFWDLAEFFPERTFAEIFEIYGFTGGIPYYINQIDATLPFWHWLEKVFRAKITFLLDEVDFLLRYEFLKPTTYFRILHAIALGHAKVNKIANAAGMKTTDLPPYLNSLIEVGFVIKKDPLGAPARSKQGRYFLQDQFVKFWFRFIFPNLSQIEQGIFDIRVIQSQYPQYLGPLFEKIVEEFLIRQRPFPLTRLGSWWWKDVEIDLIGVDEEKGHVTFIECKWQDAVDAGNIVSDLVKKALKCPLPRTSESYAIFARSFHLIVDHYKGYTVYCYDLAALSRFFRVKST